ncbi:hypothetical protein Q7P37_006140 [Cladosporium fusiforme]
MADPLSIAASIAGLLGLAGQVADGVLKLREMCATMSNAPKELSTLCSRMDIIRNLLEEAGHPLQQLSPHDVDKTSVQKVFTQCEDLRYKIAARVTDLNARIQNDKTAAVKFWLKKKEIKEMLSDVEQCKTDLILARQTIEATISCRRHEMMLEEQVLFSQNQTQLLEHAARISQQTTTTALTSASEFRSIREVHRESSSKICESIRSLKDCFESRSRDASSTVVIARIEDAERKIIASNSSLEASMSNRLDAIEKRTTRQATHKRTQTNIAFQSVLFSFSVDFSSQSEPDEKAESEGFKNNVVAKRICTIRLPRWFVRDQHNLMLTRTKNGWLFCPTIYRTVDVRCPFFEACSYGDLETVRDLLSTKQAFLSDRTAHTSLPDSALSLAIQNHRTEVCRLLVNAGILTQFQDEDYSESLLSLTRGPHDNKSEHINILHLIEPEDNSDGDWIAEYVFSPAPRRELLDLTLSRERSGISRLDRFEASLFKSTKRAWVHRQYSGCERSINTLSAFLSDAECMKELRSAGISCSWLPFAFAAHFGSACVWSPTGLWQDERLNCNFIVSTIESLGYYLHTTADVLPEDWRDLMSDGSVSRDMRGTERSADFTPFLLSMLINLDGYSDVYYSGFSRCMLGLHAIGVDLQDLAETESWRLERVLRKSGRMGTQVYGASCGPEPDDWRLLTSPPGDIYYAYSWRCIETNSIIHELTTKISAIMRHVENSDNMNLEVPGRWQEENESPESLEQTLERWLACMEDSQLAQMEIDIEEENVEAFYEMWDLEFLVEDWAAEDETELLW